MPLLAGGAAGYVDGPVAQARFRSPVELAVDDDGNLFVGDAGNLRVRKISPAGQVSTYAGCGESGWQDGLALEAKFKFPSGVSLDPRQPGALLIVDLLDHCIRAIDPSGRVTTLAGVPGEPGYRDGPARQALFLRPTSVHVGPAGDVFVVEWGNHCVRRIDPEGQTVTTLAGSGLPGFADGTGPLARFDFPTMCAIDMGGTLWVSDLRNHAIRRVRPDGTVVTVAGNGTAGYADGQGAEARFNSPCNIILDGDGNLIISDHENHCIRQMTPAGCVSTLLAPYSPATTKDRSDVVRTCPCLLPLGLELTKFSELVITALHQNRIFVVHIGAVPYRRCPVQRALFRHISNCRLPDVRLRGGCPLRLRPPGGGPDPTEDLRRAPLASDALTLVATLDTSPQEIQAFLLFSHTSEVHSPEHVFGLMVLCQWYGLQGGFLRCLWYCRRHVTPDNAVPWLVESHRRGLAVVSSWLQLFVHRQWEAIQTAAPQSVSLLQPYPELLEAVRPDNAPPQPPALPPARQALRLDAPTP
eukprot:EG_transcript_5668